MSKFAPIHIYSGYSLLQSGLTIKRIETALKNNDYFGMGITDEFTLSGLPPFAHLLKQENKPFILGLSLRVESDFFAIYAINEEGYLNISKLVSLYSQEELTYEKLKDFTKGTIGVIETNYGLFKEKFSLLEKIDTSFTKYLLKISDLFKDGFYLGIEVIDKLGVSYANKIRKFANEYTYECVGLPRIKYLKKNDAISLDILDAINEGNNIEIKSKNGESYFLKESDYHKIYTEKEIINTNKIILSNQLDFFSLRGEMLHYPCEDSSLKLREMSYSSLIKLGLKDDEKYITRLEYELSIINQMGYSDYFLIVQDYVNWSKDNNILVGPGRGSAAGSLVSYLLNITEVDPLKYDLQFERFLNPNRKTMPDIDVDFMDIKRDEVVQYMRDKYGTNRVSNIVSFQTIGAKQALRDIGRVYKIPERHISLLCKNLKDDKLTLGQFYRTNEDFKKLCDSDQYFKDIVSLAGKIEGLPRQSSLHAAGIILNNIDIASSMPISTDFNDNYISQYEFKYLEEQGFLKMDFLGLRNLTTVSYCVDLINLHYPDLHLNKQNIPYDTKEVFDLIRSGQVIGLFQIETATMRKGINIIKPTCFDDIVALLALNRPGPMAFMPNYAKRRDGLEKYSYLSKDLENILSSTYGIIVYQEQINQIATKVAGMTPGEADLFRRAISKKDKNVLQSNKVVFIKGCLNNGYDEKTALDIFNHIAKFADYGFNKAHSVAYAVLTCQMAYLKANYPLEFYSAILQTGTTSENKFSDYISEMRKRKIKILPPSINSSSLLYDVKEDALLFPFSSIHGLNSLMSKSIIEEREKGLFKDFFDFVTRMYSYKINEAQILALINSGALDELYSSRASMRISVKSALQYAELNYSETGQMNLGISAIMPPMMNVEEDRPLDNLDFEYDTLGVMLSSSPLDYKKEELEKLGVEKIANARRYGVTTIAGISKNIRLIKTKKGEQMASFKIYDETGEIDVTVFPKAFDQYKGFLTKNSILVLTGRFENKEETTFFVDKIETLGE